MASAVLSPPPSQEFVSLNQTHVFDAPATLWKYSNSPSWNFSCGSTISSSSSSSGSSFSSSSSPPSFLSSYTITKSAIVQPSPIKQVPPFPMPSIPGRPITARTQITQSASAKMYMLLILLLKLHQASPFLELHAIVLRNKIAKDIPQSPLPPSYRPGPRPQPDSMA